MKIVFKCAMLMLFIFSGCDKGQLENNNQYFGYYSTLFQYETNLCLMAKEGQKYWGKIFKDVQIPIVRKFDLVTEIHSTASIKNKQKIEKVRLFVDEIIANRNEIDEERNWDLFGLSGKFLTERLFHEAFLAEEYYIDEGYRDFYDALEGTITGYSYSQLTDLVALHGEHDWIAILTDENISLDLKKSLIISIYDVSRGMISE